MYQPNLQHVLAKSLTKSTLPRTVQDYDAALNSAGGFLREIEKAHARAHASRGSRRMAGSKTRRAHELGHTIEHSMGVTLMLRKPWRWSAVRAAKASASESSSLLPGPARWLSGRRTWRMGWRKLG